MKTQAVMAVAFASTVAVATPAAAQDRSDWPTNFTVGTASQGGTYFAYGSGWANFVAENLASPVARKSPAVRCRTWRSCIPATSNSA